ncbi:MAG: ATP-binding cassette domain-containing protein [Burkholderiales bacterium]|nr:ATP-binding cassette domain-containing protein [Burkholderiales bacterium]
MRVVQPSGVWPTQTWRILNNISFKLEPGQSLNIVGPVGAGKTVVTARMLMAEFEASSGGVDRSARPRFAYCPQETFIASGRCATT